MSHLYLTNKIKIYPDKIAQKKLWKVSYICKDLWNILNKEKRTHGGSYYKFKKLLPQLKVKNPIFAIPSSQVLQEVVKSLVSSWKMYFTKRKRGNINVNPPRFKSYKYFFAQNYPQNKVSFEVANGKLRLAYGKSKKDWIEINLPSLSYDTENIKTVTISYDKLKKKWYACFTYNVEIPDTVEISKQLQQKKSEIQQKNCNLPFIVYNPYTRQPVHIMYFDPGCKTTLTGIKTDGTIWEYDINPLREISMKHYLLIDKLKSKRDKKQKQSRRSRRLNAKIKKIYQKINTQTGHYLHKLANQILKEHPDVIAFYVGNWNKIETVSNTGIKPIDRRINRQVQNNNPIGKLIEYLSYKARMQCNGVEKFDEKGTTRTCSNCGYVYKDGVNPCVRTFQCAVCGFVTPRDVNAALNFLKFYQYAVWHGLRAMTTLSIARMTLNPVSGKNRMALYKPVILNYRMLGVFDAERMSRYSYIRKYYNFDGGSYGSTLFFTARYN